MLRKLLPMAMRTKLRLDRGSSWISFGKNILLLALVLKVFDVPFWLIVMSGPFIVLALYLVGLVDEKHGIWKKEAEYATREINPYFKKLEKKINGR